MKIYLKFMAFAIMAVSSLVWTSCSSDDDDNNDDGNENEQIFNDPNKSIVTGSVESAEISLNYRGVICKLYGYCNMLPEALALSGAEVGIEVSETMPDSGNETIYRISSNSIGSDGRFVVSSDYAKSKGFQVPLVLNYPNEYKMRAYVKTGDMYQYDEYRKIEIPDMDNMLNQLSIKTGTLSKVYDFSYRYIGDYANLNLAMSSDRNLLTEANIINAEENATNADYDHGGGTETTGRVLNGLYLYANNYRFVSPFYNLSSTTLELKLPSGYSYGAHGATKNKDSFYCEYYYGRKKDGTPVVKIGEIKVY